MTAMRLKRYPSPSGGIALGKMGVGATMLKQVKTAKDYVQSGLVAMWDGIENAGWGVHDGSATSLKNLVGGSIPDLTFTSGAYSFGEKILTCNAVRGTYFTASLIPTTCTISGCFSFDSNTTLNGLITIRRATSNGLVLFGLMANIENTALGGYNGGLGNDNGYFFQPTDNTIMQSRTIISEQDSAYSLYTGAAQEQARTFEWYPWAAGGVASILGTRYGNGWLGTYTGKFANLRIYSRALTADEIAANYAIDKERFNLP